ncbi:MAG: response regulator transcription factor [Candidatus Obscuribacterales bacterium]|nr:response regulator transcription factor [Candidatus Obscuribacterales bacterium]
MSKILVVDDDATATDTLREGLVLAGYIVDVANSAREAEAFVASSQFDCLIVDWDMPVKTGLEFVADIRRSGVKSPVLMLTGKASVDEKSRGLDNGADDYLTKPFAFKELVSRIRALMRRPQTVVSEELSSGDLKVDTLTRTAFRAGVELSLTRQEFLLLEFLLRNKNQIFSSEALVERAWSSTSESSPDTVRVHMTNLRKKLKVGDAESPIKTVHGQGYTFRSE